MKSSVLRELATGMQRVSRFYRDLVTDPDNLLSEKAYRRALLDLEADGLVIVLDKQGAEPAPASKRPKRKGECTLAESYYVMLGHVDASDGGEDEIREGECLRCSDYTDVYTYNCLSCDSGGNRYGGDQAYRKGDLWFLVNHDPEFCGDDEPMSCEFCGSTNIDIEFESMCGYCNHVAAGD